MEFALLTVYWLKENLVIEVFYRLDIIATGTLISSHTTAQFLTKLNFSDTLSKSFKIFPVIK